MDRIIKEPDLILYNKGKLFLQQVIGTLVY